MDAEGEFLKNLIKLQFGQHVDLELKNLSSSISWAHGWPEDNKAFWNAEAFMWNHKIGKKERELITNELAFLQGGKNLDVGCGAYSYIPSVGFDFSEKMLQFNDNCPDKVQGDLEKELPFADASFDSVTAIFVLNYVVNYQQLFSEIKRVLNKDGVFMMVLFAGEINHWQRQKEVNDFSREEWKSFLENTGSNVNLYEKEKLLFFRCE